MLEFKLPDVGEGIHEAEILRWLAKPGDSVALNQPILEIQTDKAIVEIPAPIAGTISEIRTEAGTLAHVGQILVLIEPAGAAAPASPAAPSHSTAPASQSAPEKTSPGISGPGQRVLAAPAVRKLALELGVNLADVPGSGPAGRVLPSDVRSFAEQQHAAPSPAPAPGQPQLITATAPTSPVATPPPGQSTDQALSEEIPLFGLRRRMAERMALAWQIPHVTALDEVEVSHLVALRQHLQMETDKRGVKLTYLSFIIKAVGQTLKEFPDFNAWVNMGEQKVVRHRAYHIGVATTTPDGLLVPVIRSADRLNLVQLAAELTRLADLGQQRKLTPAELSGSTFTITNFGSLGMSNGIPLINPPEAAILGCGRIEEKPVVAQGQVVIRPVLPLALSFDHRWLDGAAAAAFLTRLKALLADPNLLFLELV